MHRPAARLIRPHPMTDSYLPPDATPAHAADVLLHTRNKNIVVEAGKRTLRQRIAHRLWSNAARFRDAVLAQGPPSVIISEQVIENAFVLRELDSSVRKVLDFGAFESTLPLALAALGLEVTVVDQRRYPFSAERLQVLQHDILKPMTTLAAEFDVVYSISTIEHVGLGHYGDPAVPDGDRVALAHLWEKVRPGGRLIVTVPAGRPSVQRGYRVYDEGVLAAVLPAPGRIAFFRKQGRRGIWRPATSAEIAAVEYEDYYAQAPSEGVAVAVVRKPQT
jgi:2-polyprenyl-3-methyl-5-hydroxy-6-metoxy-1,4-benzoquinol methylase